MRRRTPSRRRDEAGSAVVEFTWLALILLIPLVWLVLGVFEVQRAAFAVTAAARSAGRAYVLVDDEATARQRAHETMRFVLADQGAGAQSARLTLTCEPDPHECRAPGTTVTVVVDSQVAIPWMPDVLGEHAASIAVSAQHRVPVGQFVEAESSRAEQ